MFYVIMLLALVYVSIYTVMLAHQKEGRRALGFAVPLGCILLGWIYGLLMF